MNCKATPLAIAISLAMLGIGTQAMAAEEVAPAAPGAEPTKKDKAKTKTEKPADDGITVSGIRASMQKATDLQRNAETHVEIITAEDIGKMPDKNVADAISRLPGVNVSPSSAGQFGEAEYVSLRGTTPRLTLTTLNGHSVSGGDWHVSDQLSASGRAVSYSLLPSELVNQVTVYKTAQADVVEGGLAGTVDIITRKPLGFKQQLTLQGSAGTAYDQLAGRSAPQLNGLVNWKNEANDFGVMLQLFSEKRYLRRDSQEINGYLTLSKTNPLALAHPDLAGVRVPGEIQTSLFEGQRKRDGGLFSVEYKPRADLGFSFTGFSSKMDATNYARAAFGMPEDFVFSDLGNFKYTLSPNGKVMTSAEFPNIGTVDEPNQSGQYENYYRGGAKAKSNFFDLQGKWQINDALTAKGQLGYTRGEGKTAMQLGANFAIFNTPLSYQLNGLSRPADFSYPGFDVSNYNNYTLIDGGGSSQKNIDQERNAQLDFDYALDHNYLRKLKFGTRWSKHQRDLSRYAPGLSPDPSEDPYARSDYPQWSGQLFPGDFASGLNGNFPRNSFDLSADALATWANGHLNTDPLYNEVLSSEFSLKERISAAYVMTTFEGDNWSGDVGARLVRTEDDVQQYVRAAGCVTLTPCARPGVISTSRFGPYLPKQTENTHTNLLPSANLRLDLGGGLIGRAAISKTLSRPDYSDLAGAVGSFNNTLLTATGGNPNLAPTVGKNVDASLGWYFAPRGLLMLSAYQSNLKDYAKLGYYQDTFYNSLTRADAVYTVTAPVSISAKVRGLELAWQQPIGKAFGFNANYTYAESRDADGDHLPGTSRQTANAGVFYEDYGYSARLAYNYRTDYATYLSRTKRTVAAANGTLSLSLNAQIDKQWSVGLDALNLLDPVRKYYGLSADEPVAFNKTGRQYYLSLRASY